MQPDLSEFPGVIMNSKEYSLIISAAELSRNLQNPDWVIVDCRFSLADPDWGETEYQALHIPGAVYAHLDRDLAGSKTPETGRHPLPSDKKTTQVFSALGIDSSKQVIVYDATSGSFAARLWFMLNLYGHQRVAVLDGGFAYWHMQGYPIESVDHHNLPAQFSGSFHPEMVMTTPQMEQLIHDKDWRIIDARTHERYAGESEPIDPVAGHIPGALNRFHELNLDQNGLFKPDQTLKEEFMPLLDPQHIENTVVYCGSGVTSCHHLIAMKKAGLPLPKLYVGSWSEWIRDPARPIKQDKEP